MPYHSLEKKVHINKHIWLSQCPLSEEKIHCLLYEKIHLNTLEFSSPKHDLCQVWLKLVQWFLKRRFLNFVKVFLLFRNYFHLERGTALHLYKFEPPSPKNALCQVWLKFIQWFMRRRFLFFVNVLSLFRDNLHLGKGGTLHLNKLESPKAKDAMCQVLLKLAPMIVEKKMKIWKVYNTNNDDNDDGQRTNFDQKSRKAHLTLRLRWAKNLTTKKGE